LKQGGIFGGKKNLNLEEGGIGVLGAKLETVYWEERSKKLGRGKGVKAGLLKDHRKTLKEEKSKKLGERTKVGGRSRGLQRVTRNGNLKRKEEVQEIFIPTKLSGKGGGKKKEPKWTWGGRGEKQVDVWHWGKKKNKSMVCRPVQTRLGKKNHLALVVPNVKSKAKEEQTHRRTREWYQTQGKNTTSEKENTIHEKKSGRDTVKAFRRKVPETITCRSECFWC